MKNKAKVKELEFEVFYLRFFSLIFFRFSTFP